MENNLVIDYLDENYTQHYLLIDNSTGEILIDATQTDSSSASSVSSYDEISTPVVYYDDYYEAAKSHVMDILGGDPEERGWVQAGEEYVWLENEDDVYYHWSWAAGGGFGSFEQYKSDIFVFNDLDVYD